MEKRETVLLGMSGGVDSSTAALLLSRGGYRVLGASLIVTDGFDPSPAARCAEALGLPFHTLDLREEFDREVADYLVDSYAHGKTPCPCVVCNRRIKMEGLLRLADSLGAEKIATGHYAGLYRDPVSGRFCVRRSPDAKKDQSYFLCMLSQEQLSRLVFPLCGMTKQEIRAAAAEAGLEAASRSDSQELCFIPDDDYAAFVEKRAGPFPAGDFIAPDGSVAGRHRGIVRYTVGQRKRLGIALGRPVFVRSIDPETNRVYLADAGGEFSEGMDVCGLNFQLLTPPEPALPHPLRAFVKHRAAAPPAPCAVTVLGNAARVVFDTPARAVPPGQFAVFYDDLGRLLFAGTIV